jgi:cytochrome bd-type quinol oxidase subunit 2
VKSGWLAITGLLLLSALPVVGGVFSLTEGHSGGASSSPLSPLPTIAHVVAMSTYCLIGAFQFSPALRLRSRWHRTVGRVLIPAGFLAALSSMWLAVSFDGPAAEFPQAMVRLGFAVLLLVFLVLGSWAITRRDFGAHGAWMTRAYALAVSGGTQALVFIVWSLPFGEVEPAGEAPLAATAFVLNALVAELLILRRRRATRASAIAR